MNLNEAINVRVSRRTYNNKPLTSDQITIINNEILKYQDKYPVKVKLIVGSSDAFHGFKNSYGFFSGVQNYLIFYGNKNQENINEIVGLFGEQIILKATQIGLGTCWVGGTYNKKACLINLSEKEDIICLITIGEVDEKLTLKEKLIKKVAKRKTKTISQMITSDIALPNWIINGMKAVQLAPSAVNRQPVKFVYKNQELEAYVDDVNSFQGIDLGIAKLHFTIGANCGEFEIGNHGLFKKF